jgi:hypothetical protein
MTAPQPRRITRGDLESKFRELEGGVEETKESAQSSIVTVGAILLVIVIAIAFLSGRRKGTKRSTVVEVRRL